MGSQPPPTVTMYTEAMNKFTKSATAFMDQVHLLTEARDAYQEAIAASTALRNSLDAGDETLRSLMNQLEQVVNAHLGEPLDHRRCEDMGLVALLPSCRLPASHGGAERTKQTNRGADRKGLLKYPNRPDRFHQTVLIFARFGSPDLRFPQTSQLELLTLPPGHIHG